VTTAPAHAKINLALVVGPRGPDGYHEVATVLQRIGLCDTISLEPGEALTVEGFAEDTIVTRALEQLAAAAGVEPRWRVSIEKRIPVAAGLGGGSSDAATALRLANATLEQPLPDDRLHAIASAVGADVPFFLLPGPKLGTGTGSTLEPLSIPQDFAVVLLLPDGAEKESTATVYGRFEGAAGFDERRARTVQIAARAKTAADFADLPPNDLATSPLAAEILAAGAFRADVSGAGPTLYGLFPDRAAADRAAAALGSLGRVWVTDPAC
jgi:4-diphosphocytidyl-2-C-methyl-D-erythritol kinase